MMEDEVVRRRRWLTREEFLGYLGATNLIPGPNSTELAIHIGRVRAGWPGLIVAGTCFILPAALIVTVLAWAYVRFGKLPAVEGVLYGVKPVVIAVVLQALWELARTALKERDPSGGRSRQRGGRGSRSPRADGARRCRSSDGSRAAGRPGAAGALTATVGIFLPAFVFVALSGLLLHRLRQSPTAGAVLDGVNVAPLALIAVVTVQLARSALVDPLTVGLAALSAVAVLKFRLNTAWLVLIGALVGGAVSSAPAP